MIEKNINDVTPRGDDEVINCAKADCDIAIIFTAKDQEFFASQGWTKPRYCKTNGHREEAKQARLSKFNAKR